MSPGLPLKACEGIMVVAAAAHFEVSLAVTREAHLLHGHRGDETGGLVWLHQDAQGHQRC